VTGEELLTTVVSGARPVRETWEQSLHHPIAASEDTVCLSSAPVRAFVPASLRSAGRIDLSFVGRDGHTAAHRTYQSGCMRLRIPRPNHPGEAPCAVLINTAGGLADGDRIEQRVHWGENTVATVATQAAEKVYRALAPGADVTTFLNVAQGADAEWLPQETILFDNARLRRETRIVLAENVTFLGLEAVVLGRQAMGETVRRGALIDRMRIWRHGRLVYADTLALDGAIGELMAKAAIGGGARAMAVLVHASDRAAAFLEPVRDALREARGLVAASSWNGLLAVRMLAPDGETLRRDISNALAVLREGRALPRVWRC
jgi:urease accessory protein